MKEILIDKIQIIGIASEELQENEHVVFDTPITIESGHISKDNNGNTIVTYKTTKTNIFGEDITKKAVVYTDTEMFEDMAKRGNTTLAKSSEVNIRLATDEEFNTLKAFLEKEEDDWCGQASAFFGVDNQINNRIDLIRKEELTVNEINKDFKIIIQNYCELEELNNGEQHVTFETIKYSCRNGVIKRYDEYQNSDSLNLDFIK